MRALSMRRRSAVPPPPCCLSTPGLDLPAPPPAYLLALHPLLTRLVPWYWAPVVPTLQYV